MGGEWACGVVLMLKSEARFGDLHLKRMCVSLLEMFCEAAGTTFVMLALSLIEAGQVTKGDLALGPIFGITIAILFYFTLTGYVLTIGIVGTFFRSKSEWVNPVASALLYLVHSTIFFAGVGNRVGNWGRDNLAIQLCGAVVAFVCGYLGNRLVVRWAGRL
jgi:hypothetical protein